MAVHSSNQRVMRLTPHRHVLAIVDARIGSPGMEPPSE
jgi:hypothetical protein